MVWNDMGVTNKLHFLFLSELSL